jgi:acetoin utilization deacetylase AcuC-like enzyme
VFQSLYIPTIYLCLRALCTGSVNVELSPVTDKLAPGDRAARGKLQKAKLDKLCAAASVQFRQRCGESLLPALAAFKPDLLLISAGFDGHWEDNVSAVHTSV